MFSTKTKHILAWAVLSLFVLIKVSGLHEFTHHNKTDQQNCVLCHLATRDNLTPVLSVDHAIHFENPNRGVGFVFIDNYQSLFPEKLDDCELYNKPPPAYTVSTKPV